MECLRMGKHDGRTIGRHKPFGLIPLTSRFPCHTLDIGFSFHIEPASHDLSMIDRLGIVEKTLLLFVAS